jgi:hypothetical protein
MQSAAKHLARLVGLALLIASNEASEMLRYALHDNDFLV